IQRKGAAGGDAQRGGGAPDLLMLGLPGFLAHAGVELPFFFSEPFKKHIKSISHTGTIAHYTIEQAKATPINTCYDEEQTQIGNYFQELDALINQHQQKHDKLCKFKKSMLEKMFPKQGKTMPEIRFKGFSGEWEEKELGELAEIVRGASPRPIEDPKWFDNQSSVGWLRIRDVTEQDGRIHYLEQRISKLGQEKTRVLHEKHLLLSIAASVGKPVVNYVQTGVHDGFLIFKKPLFELEFMYQWLKSFEAKWQQFGQPGSQVNLNSDIVKSQTVTIPTKEEQIAIGNYFKKLDDLINRHQQQITKLNNIKQACLSKMFV
ncbi:restriction endonuclease subunit S, partial [Serratia sp. IR-2025]